MTSPCLPGLGLVAFLAVLLSADQSGASSLTMESICAVNPALQTLDEDGLAGFGCPPVEETNTFNCSGRHLVALPLTSDRMLQGQGFQVMDFSHNNIKCVPRINNTSPTCSLTHCHSACLLDLRLQGNVIDFLHRDAFLNLTCLESLDLSDNRLTNTSLQGHHFFRLGHLQRLDLHGNPLQTLPDNVLISTHLSHLHTLNLSSCLLHAIGEAALDDFFELQVLDLSHNRLNVLAGRTFQGLTYLRVLDLRWNRLEVILKDTFADLRELKDLRLQHNRLWSFSELAFHPLVNFPSLQLSHNRFSDIPYYAVATLKHLRSLDVSHNVIRVLKQRHVMTSVQELRLDYLDNLTRVEDGAFSSFPRMSTFSLRFARGLRVIHGNAFRGVGATLREVHLDHNGLAYLTRSLLPWQQLSLLTLHGNPWNCDCELAWAAGRVLGNTTVRCHDPRKLEGQDLPTLRPSDLSCPVDLTAVTTVVSLAVVALVAVVGWLYLWPKRRRMPCRCIRGIQGRYVTVFTKEGHANDNDALDSSCGEGQMDDLDLDLGSGSGSRSTGEGTARIMLNTFRNGYQRLRTHRSESAQDLTMEVDV